ncbi:HlyD family efflux transporter periplasmic adaptor subunit [Roseisalinus antarcticus]|uniref:Multidrug resistance protein MdtN n=1 Tax=Roseisalinus antarcticus TaxID=254357 RepID=A0A1Y5TFV0_9RHOB|nr:HlyD family efflux transporter periplasmic adaptor subunit [Roseisalinus antarcticus]SLN63102.1 multidrug resistance protein MdtN [Roseisalinus antarcticus]
MKPGLASSKPDAVSPAGTSVSEHALFAMGWCVTQARELGEGATILLLIREADGVLRPQGRAPSDWHPTEPVRMAAAAVAETGKPSVRAAGPGRAAIALASRIDGTAAVAAAEIDAGTDAERAAALRRLQWGLAGVEAHLLRLRAGAVESPTQISLDGGASDALKLLVRSLETDGYRDCARAAATDLAVALGADRVAIARNRRRGARVEALSHTADFKGRTRALDLLTAAADEALDQTEALVWPAGADARPLSRRQLEALAHETGSGSVVALPIGDVERPWGAIVAEFAAPEAGEAALPVLDIAGDALAPLLELKRREDRLWITRAWEGSVAGLATLIGPKALGWKLAALVLAGLIFAAATVTAPARVTADAEITSDDRVIVSVPFDGFLAERLVRAGDVVQAGQLLARLDDRDLSLDLLRQEATRRQKEIERDAAIANNNRAELSVLSAEIAEVDAEIALTEAQLEAGRLRAPYDGVVTLDATEGLVGAPVGRGEELLTLAPREQRSLTLHVPDAGVDRVRRGQTGTLRLAAMPERPLTFEVTRLTPLTEARDGENTFRALARLTGEVPADLGLGMEGVGKITTGTDLWVMTWGRPFLESLRLRLWSMWP